MKNQVKYYGINFARFTDRTMLCTEIDKHTCKLEDGNESFVCSKFDLETLLGDSLFKLTREIRTKALSILKEHKKISFSYLYSEELDEDGNVDDYEDNRPSVLVEDKHGYITDTIIDYVEFKESDPDDILSDYNIVLYGEEYNAIPGYCVVGDTLIDIYLEILRFATYHQVQ